MQFPDDAHDTDVNCALGKSFWIPLANTAGRASCHTPFVDVMVNASGPLGDLNCPTAVQCPSDVHDTDLNVALADSAWTPPANTAGRAGPHTPFIDVIVSASVMYVSLPAISF